MAELVGEGEEASGWSYANLANIQLKEYWEMPLNIGFGAGGLARSGFVKQSEDPMLGASVPPSDRYFILLHLEFRHSNAVGAVP